MRIITRLFAVIGFLVVVLFALGIAAAWHHKHKLPVVADNVIMTLTLDGELPDKAGFDPLNLDHKMTLGDTIRALREAGKEGRIKGVFLNIQDNLPLTQVQELHTAIAEFRKSGKPIYAFADTFGEQDAGAAEYYLATACDQVWLQPMGTVGLMGIAADEFFLKDFLSRNGIQFQSSKREEYKTAFDTLSENGFTAPNREMTQSLLGDMIGQIVTGVASDRKLDQDIVRKAMDTGPLSADDAKDMKLIDEIDYRDKALDALLDETDADDTISARRFLDTLKIVPSKNKIAVIYAEGELMRHSGVDPLDPIADSKASDPRDVFSAFRDASEDDNVKAIVFRINSPGGSVVASETIRGGVLLAKDAGIPIIVSMGDMAGSGGYWIAADADRIIAEPATLTGSIGVLGGKPVLAGIMKDHGIATDSVEIGRNANMDSMFHAFTPEQQAKQDEMLDDIYNTFKDIVAAGRKLSPERVEQIAKGRVYTGKQGLAVGLIDELGGIETAYTRAREAAGLSATDTVEFIEVPRAPTLLDYIKSIGNGGRDDDDSDDTRLPYGHMGVAKLQLLTMLRPYLHLLTRPPAQNAVLMPVAGQIKR